MADLTRENLLAAASYRALQEYYNQMGQKLIWDRCSKTTQTDSKIIGLLFS